MKIRSIKKSCSRKITDGNYGSVETSTEITVALTGDETREDLAEISKKLALQVRSSVTTDLKEYKELQSEKKVY